MNRIARNNFKGLFTVTNVDCYDLVFDAIVPKVTALDNERLLALFMIVEFKATFSSMHPDKSLIPDGFNLTFLKVLEFIRVFFFYECQRWVLDGLIP